MTPKASFANIICQETNHIKNSIRRIIGSFIAASNITGILNDDLAITALLRSRGALALWDYATAAPYVNIDMNPKVLGTSNASLFEKDAVFFSAHKFVGGPQGRCSVMS